MISYKVLIVIWTVLCYTVTNSVSLNILAITPHVGKSHQLVFEPLFRKLVSNGHRLTLITRFPMKGNSPNLRSVSLVDDITNSTELFTFDLLTGTRFDRYWIPLILTFMAEEVCSGLAHPTLQNFLKEDNKFDVVLIETFNTNCFMGIAKKYNTPIIGLHSATWMPWMYEWFGVPYNPGALPGHFSGNTDEMNLFERIENTVLHVYTSLLYTFTMGWRGNALSKQYIGEDLYANGDVMKSVDLLLINAHYALNLPIALPPNVIEVGGIHVDSQPIKKLPQDLELFISNSKDGVIYMSMGSTIRGDSFPEAKKQAFLKAFSRLPQRVIWKWEGEMENKPDNVFITRWAPQRDILCHPNVKVFITHAGFAGCVEGSSCGKPMLLLPQFGDQFTNAAAIEKVGGGIEILLSEITEDVVYNALRKLLSPQFAESAKNLQARMNDRPLSPTDTALFWIDYVVRHKGAPFMRSAAIDMPLYQYLLLDVIVVLLIVTFIISYIYYLCFKFFIKKLCSKKENKQKKS